ncbi:hypothetical protein E5161_16625 [Cohnella pontilimi]|uniref:4-fold beta flower domain-containing protein n=1 Tax=Cohnella pontilimi TaxID=2564100 RepID=A0A4V5LS13_9BACL|nr:hypothetical protein [Cohnella pontilimi]TJY40769.1 hypothetical protein E5161_16625 [Cohnella pontilimi]
MLQALYDRYCTHVAWLERNRYIYDTDMNWLAFIHNKHQVWTKGTVRWAGTINGVICLDQEGKVVAWGVGQKIAGDPSIQKKPKYVPKQPPEPAGVLRPLLPNPPIPGTPLLGWSPLTFEEWIKP